MLYCFSSSYILSIWFDFYASLFFLSLFLWLLRVDFILPSSLFYIYLDLSLSMLHMSKRWISFS